MSSPHTEKAYAKINLNLEIIGRRADGYHELVSLVSFARDVFDIITIKPSGNFSLHVSGPSSHKIDGNNIIVQTVKKAESKSSVTQLGHIELVKNLPVAAGLGGGSADSAAVLRAIAKLNDISDIATEFADICPEIGADVTVCLQSGASEGALMWGIGEQVWRPSAPDGALIPSGIGAVLVNPGAAVPTGDIFRALGASPLETAPAAPDMPGAFRTFEQLVQFLQTSRNDLETPARAVAPVINDVLAELGDLPHCALARMSGSGATCFGLFQSLADAQTAKEQLASKQPQWWVQATRLG